MATLLTIYTIRMAIELRYWVAMVEVINDTMQLSFGIYAYWTVIYDSIFYRREHRQFWLALQHIYNNRFCHHEMQLRGFLFKFIAYMTIMDTAFLTNFALQGGGGIIDYAAYLILNHIGEIRMFYYVLCTEVLCFQLKMIAKELKLIRVKPNNENTAQQLNRIREYYQHVYRMAMALNSIFGWSNVALILYGFYKPMTEFNWWYAHFHEISVEQNIGE